MRNFKNEMTNKCARNVGNKINRKKLKKANLN